MSVALVHSDSAHGNDDTLQLVRRGRCWRGFTPADLAFFCTHALHTMSVRTTTNSWHLLLVGAPWLGVAFMFLAASQGEPEVLRSAAALGIVAVKGTAHAMSGRKPLMSPGGTTCVGYRHVEQGSHAKSMG